MISWCHNYSSKMAGITFTCFCGWSHSHPGPAEEEGKGAGSSSNSNSAFTGGEGEGDAIGVDKTEIGAAFYDKTEWKKIMETKKLPVVHPEVMPYEKFFTDYIVKNIPCMVSSRVTEGWLSKKKWVKQGEKEEVDFEYLLSVYGDEYVSVVNCDDSEYKGGYGARDCRVMLFQEYIAYWKKLINSRKDTTAGIEGSPCLYLKDWHIVRYHQSKPELTSTLPYETPIYFTSDFLNETCNHNDSDDFKFCYMGPAGSFTSFHADVYGSYSWSANVFGIKKWFLYPPGKERRFYDDKTKALSYNWEEPGIEGEDYLEVIQEAGECIFVPSGWHHIVWNVTDAISINHNWFNGANLTYIWNVLRKELEDVEKELDDLRHIPEFNEQCQLVLKANHGMNYEDFFKMLKLIKHNRENGDTSKVPQSASFQLKYDLDAIHHLIQEHCSLDPTCQDFLSNVSL